MTLDRRCPAMRLRMSVPQDDRSADGAPGPAVGRAGDEDERELWPAAPAQRTADLAEPRRGEPHADAHGPVGGERLRKTPQLDRPGLHAHGAAYGEAARDVAAHADG